MAGDFVKRRPGELFPVVIAVFTGKSIVSRDVIPSLRERYNMVNGRSAFPTPATPRPEHETITQGTPAQKFDVLTPYPDATYSPSLPVVKS